MPAERHAERHAAPVRLSRPFALAPALALALTLALALVLVIVALLLCRSGRPGRAKAVEPTTPTISPSTLLGPRTRLGPRRNRRSRRARGTTLAHA